MYQYSINCARREWAESTEHFALGGVSKVSKCRIGIAIGNDNRKVHTAGGRLGQARVGRAAADGGTGHRKELQRSRS